MFHVKHQPPNNQQEKDNTSQTPPPTTQPSNYVSRETSPNTQLTTTQKPYSEAHTKGSTASKSSKSSHTSKLIQPLEKSILLKSSHACQCLETLNRISQQLNKIQNQCFTWNIEKPSNTGKHNQAPHPIKQASKHNRRHKRFPSQALPMFHVKHSK